MLPDETFFTLSIPVPPDPLLEQALGYTGRARFFATWWEPCGDEAMVSDGCTTATGEWQGFLAYVQHPVIYPALYRIDLGSSETEAKAWLVIDRQERKALIAKPKDARAFLSQQWPQTDQILHIQDLDQLLDLVIDRFQQMDTVTVQDVMHWMENTQKAVAALTAWLNEQALSLRG
jgi:hypothetical protein